MKALLPPSNRVSVLVPKPRAYTLLELMLVLTLLTAVAGMSWPALMRPWSRSLAQQAAREFVDQVMDARLRAIEECRTYRVQWKPGTGEYEISSPAGEAEFSAQQSAETRSAIPDNAEALRDPAAKMEESAELGATPVAAVNSARNPGLVDTALLPLPTRAPWHVNGTLLHGVVFRDPRQTDDADLLNELDTPAADAMVDSAQSSLGAEDQTLPTERAEAEPDDATEQQLNEQQWAPPIWIYPDGKTSNRRLTLQSEDHRELDLELRGLTGTIRVGNVRNPRRDKDEQTGSEAAPPQ